MSVVAPDRARVNRLTPGTASERLEPRLVDIKTAAKYLGDVSPWTLRALIANGELHPVRLPSIRHRGENGRRLLFDVRDLDDAIDRWRRNG
jgi:hypothetical protein